MLSMIKKLGKIFKTHSISFYQCLLEAGVLLVLALRDGEALLGGVEDVEKSLGQGLISLLILLTVSELLNQDLNKTCFVFTPQ